MYTIYENPMDYPGHFVVRRFLVHGGEVSADGGLLGAPVKTLEAARAQVPAGLYRLDRQRGDALAIRETWL